MPQPRIRTGLKRLLRGLPLVLGPIAGVSFFFGGRLIHALASIDRFLAEMLGIAVAFVCLIDCVIAKYWMEDIEWKEANEQAAEADSKTKP